jgi:redox-regulated HSP33 family molecular chaperone
VIKALDLARDFAIDGEAQTPKVVSTKTTRDIVQWHQSSLKVMQASDSGWVQAVGSGLDEVVNKLEPGEKQKFTPYVSLVKAILTEVTR